MLLVRRHVAQAAACRAHCRLLSLAPSMAAASQQRRRTPLGSRGSILWRRRAAASLHSCAPRHGKVLPFVLADIGEGIKEVEVLQWHVAEGDAIDEFDPLCEVQSDKATVEITSRYKGHVTKLYHETGDMAQTGEPLCDIELEGEDGGDEDAPPAEVAAPAAVPAPAAPVATVSEEAPELAVVTSGKVLTTPAVRRMAREFNLDLAAVALTATGKNGRIMKEDVIAFMEAPAAPPARVVVAAAAPTTGPAVATPPPVRPTEYLNVPADRVEPVSAMTKVMIRTMTAANNVPHFTYGDEMRLDRLVSLRKSLLPAAEARGGGKLSYMPFIIKATSLALAQYPILNSSLQINEASGAATVAYHGAHNISIAIDSPNGLIVPNIKAVQSLSIFEVADELARLAANAKGLVTVPSDLQGGTFALSNIGAIGGTYASPVVMLPQVAIGAVGRLQTLPRFGADGVTVEAASVMVCSWAADHRIIDGATMANFSNAFKGYLEHPELMLTEMR